MIIKMLRKETFPTYEKAEIATEIEFESTVAAYSIWSAEKMLRPYVDGYGRLPCNVISNAYRIIRTDGTARKYGRLMSSRFAGSDDATGEKFAAGTDIYRTKHGTIVVAAPTIHPEWMK